MSPTEDPRPATRLRPAWRTSTFLRCLVSRLGTLPDRPGRCRLEYAFAWRAVRDRESPWRNHPLSEPRRIHLIGVCGTAMATVAALLKRRGHDVRGSDQNVYPPMSDFLAAEQIPILTPFSVDNIDDGLDLVIVGNAISRGNPELEAVLEKKIR